MFAASSYADRLSSELKAENIGVCGMRRANVLDRALMAARHHSPLCRFLMSGGGPLERLARKRGVQFMWFVGGGAYDALDIPYMATVWDLQHRTHPWFPEVSHGGRWDYREVTQSRFLQRASHVITGTEIGRDQLGWYYQVPAERISVLPHPAPTAADIERVSEPISAKVAGLKNDTFLLYPAQFWSHKNHVNLLLGLKVLREKFGHTPRLALTGSDKGNADYVRRQVDQLGLANQVAMLGFVSGSDLAYLYQHAKALVYVSWSGPENLPPLEAFSYGCPVINADFPGAREQLGSGALYVDPSDPEAIARGIQAILENGSLREQLVENGRERAMRWTTADYVERVFAILNSFEPVRRAWE